jgi:hypothetical protein
MSKQGLGAGIVVVLVIVFATAAYLYKKPTVFQPAGEQSATSTIGTFSSAEAGLSFTYPNSYELRSGPGDAEGPSYVIMLMSRDSLPVGANTEAPPAIIVQEFANPKNLPLDEWIKTTGASNWQLSTKGEMAGSTVGDEPGLGYAYSGLYETTAVAVAHGGKIYLFTVDTLTPDDAIKADFFSLLDTVHFN